MRNFVANRNSKRTIVNTVYRQEQLNNVIIEKWNIPYQLTPLNDPS